MLKEKLPVSILSSERIWKVVHVSIPEGIRDELEIDNGYAVATVKKTIGEPCVLIPLRYSGYLLIDHAITHCNTLNMNRVSPKDKMLGDMWWLLTKYAYDVPV
jgi:hypothetical protein